MSTETHDFNHSLIAESIDGQFQSMDKQKLIQTIKQLSLENEQQSGIIRYQKDEIQTLASRLLDAEKRLADQDEAASREGTLMPLLEAMEEEPPAGETKRLHQLLHDAFLNRNSRYYQAVNTFLVGLILFSVISVTLESVPSLTERWGAVFRWSELIVVGLFTIEYVINIYVARDKLGYIFSIWGLIDLAAILPSYFHLMDLRGLKLARTLRIVRFLRTIRMMRILKLTKNTTDQYHRSARQRIHTLKLDLQIYITALLTVIIICSTLVYYAEHSTSGTAFTSIPASMWWCVVTITTVGYGDMYPSTLTGKFIASVAMIMGLALFGILMNVIGKAMMTSLFGTTDLE
ncbi:MAG: ion transporter [bacterium]